jgi:hypothetical protein
MNIKKTVFFVWALFAIIFAQATTYTNMSIKFRVMWVKKVC